MLKGTRPVAGWGGSGQGSTWWWLMVCESYSKVPLFPLPQHRIRTLRVAALKIGEEGSRTPRAKAMVVYCRLLFKWNLKANCKCVGRKRESEIFIRFPSEAAELKQCQMAHSLKAPKHSERRWMLSGCPGCSDRTLEISPLSALLRRPGITPYKAGLSMRPHASNSIRSSNKDSIT